MRVSYSLNIILAGSSRNGKIIIIIEMIHEKFCYRDWFILSTTSVALLINVQCYEKYICIYIMLI